jgi:hypothetical protein
MTLSVVQAIWKEYRRKRPLPLTRIISNIRLERLKKTTKTSIRTADILA